MAWRGAAGGGRTRLGFGFFLLGPLSRLVLKLYLAGVLTTLSRASPCQAKVNQKKKRKEKGSLSNPGNCSCVQCSVSVWNHDA